MPVQVAESQRGQRYHALPAYTLTGILRFRVYQGSTDGPLSSKNSTSSLRNGVAADKYCCSSDKIFQIKGFEGQLVMRAQEIFFR